MTKKILITGGTGLVGTSLTKTLQEKGYQVAHLSRKKDKESKIETFIWDIDNQKIDEKALVHVDAIIHLSGAGIAEKRWTKERKQLIIDSRVKSTDLLYKTLLNHPNQVKTFITASATGYYSNRGDELLTEESPSKKDFLGTCCVLWEAAADPIESLNIRVVKLRTGVVLDKKGGALPQLAQPVKLGVGSPIGSGKQWVPWVHHQDVTDMYIFVLEKQLLKGVFNMVAPHPVTNETLTKQVAKALNKPFWAPNVPAFVLKIMLGEMAEVVLSSTKVSSEKIEKEGFKFKFPAIEKALADIYQ